MKKRLISVFMALLIVFTSINFDVAHAADMPEPYRYWAISVSTYVKIDSKKAVSTVGGGRNLEVHDDIEGLPYNKSLSVTVISDARVPSEYSKEKAEMMTYEDWIDLGCPILENKDVNEWRIDDTLKNIDSKGNGGAALPYTSDGKVYDGNKFDATINIPDKEGMMTVKFDENGSSTGLDRTYKPVFVVAVIRIPHEKFDPDTGEWDIESKVEADLNISEESPAKWNYKDFDAGYTTEYAANLDASGSSSARPQVTYTYDMGIDGDYKNEKTDDSDSITLYGDISPEDIYPKDYTGKKRSEGSFKVNGTVTVEDDKGVSDTAYDDTKIGYRIVNEKPTAIYSAVDKEKNSDKYLYAKRSICIKDKSLDLEDNLMDSDFYLYDGIKKIASWSFRKDKVDSVWSLVSSDKSDEYISDMSINTANLENTLTFKKSGSYRIEQVVKDIRNHEIVTQKSDTKDSTLNIRTEAEAPKADFIYVLNGKPTDYTYPNVEVELVDKSTDSNDDIIKWEWTKHDSKKEEGQNGIKAVYTAEGTYNNTLKVTDFLGLSDSITKPIEVLPPIPKAEIVTNEDESFLKKNRRIDISSEKSFAPPTDPIQWEKTKWSIVPIDGQNSSSIKISSTLSNTKKKSVVFKEVGKYKVVIDLENNYSSANPNHPKINIKKSEIIIEIKEDEKPEPRFNITGNSPNFQDNPISTVAKVGNTSISSDSDYLDTFPSIGLEDANNFFGRGQNAFEMEIRKDINEDGIFGDDEIYGNYSGRSVDISVFFKEGEGSDYQATLKVKETFGQPTIKEFVNDDDRVTNTLVKKFAINWIPDIKFDIPDWAYPDDTINFVTQIKDEKPAITNVVWSVQKRDSAGVYRIVNIDSVSIYSLTRNGGNIQFKESGFYILKADITDEKGQKSSYQDNIRIYPFPTAVLSDDFRFDNTDSPKTFNAKQNRKYLLSGNNSYINDPYGTGIHNIDHSKDYYEIIPLQAQPLDSIKVTDGLGGLLTLKSEDGSIFKSTNKKLDTDMLFNIPGEYKVRYQVTNVHGKKSEMIEQVIKIHQDKVPTVQFEIIENSYRDPKDSNQAKLLAYDIKIYSTDRDNISLERVRYRFDSNNNGKYEDETWQNAGVIDKKDPTNWKVEVKRTHVGKYEFEIYAEESYGQPTIDRYVDKNGTDKQTTTIIKSLEINNLPPTADFDIIKKHKVDIVFATGKTNPNNIKELNAKINTYITSFLNANGGDILDTNISTIETSKVDADSVNAEEIFSKWSKFPNVSTWGYDILNKYVYNNDNPPYETGFINPDAYEAKEYKFSSDVFINEPNQPVGLVFKLSKSKDYKDRYNMYYWWRSGDYAILFKVKNAKLYDPRNTWGGTYSATPLLSYRGDTISWANRISMNDSFIGNYGVSGGNYADGGTPNMQSHSDWLYYYGADSRYVDLGRDIYKYEVDKIFVDSPKNQNWKTIGTFYISENKNGPWTYLGGMRDKFEVSQNDIHLDKFRYIKGTNGNCLDEMYGRIKLKSTQTLVGWPYHEPYDYGGFKHNTPLQRDISVTNLADPIMETTIVDYLEYPMLTGWHNMGIETNGKDIKCNFDDKSIVVNDNDFYEKGTFGFFQYSHVGPKFKNFNYEIVKKKTLEEVLRTSTWRDGATRFVINIDDSDECIGYENKILNQISYLKLISMLLKNNIYYIGLGTSENFTQSNKLINDNQNKGIFLYNNSPNIENSFIKSAEYILNIIKSIPTNNSKYYILNENIKYNILYDDYENDPQYNIHDWKYKHDETYFENDLGKISEHNQWVRGTLNGGITSFNKTGKYIVEYKTKDNPVGNDDKFDIYRKWSSMPNGPMTLYVHRKPIANASFKISKSGTSMNVSLKSLGYDLDHISMANKGIIQKEWFYREVGSSTWINGGTGETLSFTGNTTKNYLVKHRVRDIDGEGGIGVWSDDNIIVITSSPLPPVANFEVNPIVYPLGTSLAVKDFSYDPNGDNIVEYRWQVSKGNTIYLMPTLTNDSGVTQNQVDTVATAVKAKIDSLGHNAYGDWLLELQLRDNTGNWGDPLSTSDKVSKIIKVVPNNLPPSVNINPTHVFVDGKNPIDIDNITSPLNNFINWNLSVSDPNADNKGFLYRWELEHHDGEKGILKSTSEISSKDKLTTKVYTSKYPFTNLSFENNNLLAGAYKVRLKVTDIPTYGEAKSTSVEKNLYIVPKINAVPYVISDKDEILCGDTVTLRVITDKITTGITAEILGNSVELSEVRKSGDQYVWEVPFVVPEIEDSGDVDIDFTVKTSYGSKDIFGNDNQTTRIKKLKEIIYVTALKLEDFRVTDLVKHSQYKDMYPLRRNDFTLDYITGYYCTFNIDEKGNPERVFAKVSHSGTEISTVELKKIGTKGIVGIWEGKYFAPLDTPKGTIISFDLEATKNTSRYNYNEKESWNGDTLEIKDTLLKDVAISRTN